MLQVSFYSISTIFLFFILSTAQARQADLILTAGGDVNFSKHLWKPNSQGVGSGRVTMTFEEMTRGLVPLIQGADVNFANIETVVTDRMDLRAVTKSFNFQAHPQSVEHLRSIGFNLFSLANNHSYDYGLEGVEETIRHTERIEQRDRQSAFAGLGKNIEDALEPRVLRVKNYKIGMIALGNTSAHPTSQRAGVLSYNQQAHYKEALRRLKALDVDLRIVSIHTGTEARVDLDHGQRVKFLDILAAGNIDVILGHHPHVVRPAEIVQGKLIFYSLGNYFMVGSANITQRGLAVDYGLLTKIYFYKNARNGRLEASAVQALPLTNTHGPVRLMNPAQSRARVQYLNQLSQKNIQQGEPLLFNVEETTGTGIWTR